MSDQSPLRNRADRRDPQAPRRPQRVSPPLRLISATECGALLAVCAADPDPYSGSRDAAIIAVLAATGLRASEVTELELADWDPDSATLRVRTVKGRGLTAHLPPIAGTYLHAWLARRGMDAGSLFPALRDGKVVGQLSREQLNRLLRARASQAGVPHLRTHDLRATLVLWLHAQNPADLAPYVLGVQRPRTTPRRPDYSWANRTRSHKPIASTPWTLAATSSPGHGSAARLIPAHRSSGALRREARAAR